MVDNRNIHTTRIVKRACHLLLFLIAIASGGCRTQKTVSMSERVVRDTIRTVRIDTLKSMSHHTDSVTVRDSTFVMLKGDTVIIREWHWRDNHSARTDTLLHTRVDTLWREKSEIECQSHTSVSVRRRTAIEKILLFAGSLALFITLLLLIRQILVLIIKKRIR